jgi:CRISPR-associated protein (TIGR02584 family)
MKPNTLSLQGSNNRNGSNMDLSTYKKRILIAVTGKSPQILTETLFALTQQQQECFVPTDIYLLTTSDGADTARLNLLDPRDGEFYHLCRDFNLQNVNFVDANIVVIKRTDGTPMSDIRDRRDNQAAADFISQFVYQLITDYPKSAIHASIAGGRKTMGFYLAYALSLFGREQDRLSHVLVDAEYEGNPEFYYPTPYSKAVHTRDGFTIDASKAMVELADIKFVRMSAGLQRDLLQPLVEGRVSYNRAVASIQAAHGPKQLLINLVEKTVLCGSSLVDLDDALLAFYALFAGYAQQDILIKSMPADQPSRPLAEEMLNYYRLLTGDSDTELAGLQISDGGAAMRNSYLSTKKSELGRKLKEQLGSESSHYSLHSRKVEQSVYYYLNLSAEKITIVLP